MKKIIFVFLLISFGYIGVSFSQDSDEWTTQTFVTGYFALNGELVDLPVFKDVKGTNKAIGIGETSVLTSIQPLEKIKINAVFTYKPRYEWAEVITELNGVWMLSEKFNIKAGRFLLGLHPANNQYYAPMNVGISLPIFVTNHSLFPLNINGLSLNGKFMMSDNFSFGYDFSAGQYTKRSRTEDGLLGFFGRDGVYFSTNATQISMMIAQIEAQEYGLQNNNFFGTANKLCIKLFDKITLEGASFYSNEKLSVSPNDSTTFTTKTEIFNNGANLIVDISSFHLKGGAWFGSEVPDDLTHFQTYKTQLYYGELYYNIKQVTPYTKVEVVNGRSKDFNRVTLGINIRPIYEFTFKAEVIRYMQDYVDDFNVFQISLVYSF